jgi:putative ABC transport system permease protein
LALGVYLTYSVLKTTDLTVDGSFVLGASTFAKLVSLGFSPVTSLISALLAGALAGIALSFIQIKGRIHALIASILAVFILSSVNLMIMQKPNISLLMLPTLLEGLTKLQSLGLLFGLVVSILLSTLWLLKSQTGLILKALGENSLLVKMMSIRADRYKALGLVLSNTLAAFAGTMSCQFYGYSDIHMGFGMALIGIGTVAMAKELQKYLLPSHLGAKPEVQLACCFINVFLYFLSLNLLIYYGLSPIHIKMTMGIFLIACLSMTQPKEVHYA